MGNLLRHGVHDGLRGHDGACNCSFGVDGLAGRIQIGRIASAVGLDPAATRDACAAPHYRQCVEDNTAQAIQLGVFGAPTFVVGKQLFWGNDRIPMLARYLAGALSSRN